MKDADVPAAALEDPRGEHRAHLRAQTHVAAHRRVVEHVPEPEEGLDPGPLLRIEFAVILRLEGRVVRIEGRQERLGGDGQPPVGQGSFVVGSPQVEPGERLAHDQVPIQGRVVQALRQFLDEAGIDFLPDRTDRKLTEWHVNANLAKRSPAVKP